LGGFCASGAAQSENAVIAIRVYNRDRVKGDTLRASEEMAQRILRAAGIGSAWLDCLTQQGESSHSCDAAPGPLTFNITLVKHWDGGDGEENKLGLAVQNPPGLGTYCYVFTQRLSELVSDTHVHPARLLGTAMAHEVGHLLKGSNSHSPSGIMAAQWHGDEIQAVRMGTLAFTAQDEAAMRARLTTVSAQKARKNGTAGTLGKSRSPVMLRFR
jgi:hypothetical protein